MEGEHKPLNKLKEKRKLKKAAARLAAVEAGVAMAHPIAPATPKETVSKLTEEEKQARILRQHEKRKQAKTAAPVSATGKLNNNAPAVKKSTPVVSKRPRDVDDLEDELEDDDDAPKAVAASVATAVVANKTDVPAVKPVAVAATVSQEKKPEVVAKKPEEKKEKVAVEKSETKKQDSKKEAVAAVAAAATAVVKKVDEKKEKTGAIPKASPTLSAIKTATVDVALVQKEESEVPPQGGSEEEKKGGEEEGNKAEEEEKTGFDKYKDEAKKKRPSPFGLPEFNGFEPDYNDHFETDLTACQDVLGTLEELRSLVRPNCPEAFGLYDPYYCDGTIAKQWRELGIERIFHENRDFYEDIKMKEIPPKYDILVTNPPFSGDHIQRLFNFLVNDAKKPFAVLIPDYVATKDWYKALLKERFETVSTGGVMREEAQDSLQAFSGFSGGGPIAASGGGGADGDKPAVQFLSNNLTTKSEEKLNSEPFYLVPKHWYQFKHPEATGRAQGSHFKCMWFVWLGRRTVEVVSALQCKMPAREDLHGMEPPLAVVHGMDALVRGRHIRVDTRKNPKQRAALKQGGSGDSKEDGGEESKDDQKSGGRGGGEFTGQGSRAYGGGGASFAPGRGLGPSRGRGFSGAGRGGSSFTPRGGGGRGGAAPRGRARWN